MRKKMRVKYAMYNFICEWVMIFFVKNLHSIGIWLKGKNIIIILLHTTKLYFLKGKNNCMFTIFFSPSLVDFRQRIKKCVSIGEYFESIRIMSLCIFIINRMYKILFWPLLLIKFKKNVKIIFPLEIKKIVKTLFL